MTQVEVPQVSLQRYFELLKRRRWQVIPVSLIGLMVGGIVAFFIPRYYVADTLITHQAIPDQLQTSAEDPFKAIVESAFWTIPYAVEEAMQALGWQEARATGYELQENLRAARDRLEVIDVNQFAANRKTYAQIRVKFKDRDGTRAADFLNALVDAWIKKRLQELREPSEAARAAASDQVRKIRQEQDLLLTEKQGLELQYKLDPTLSDALQYAKLQQEGDLQRELRARRDTVEREVAGLQELQDAARERLVSVPVRIKEDPIALLEEASRTDAGKKIVVEIVYFREMLQNFQPGTSGYAEAQRGIAASEKRLLALIGPRDVDADGLVPNKEHEALRNAIAGREQELAVKAAELALLQKQSEAEDTRIAGLAVGHAQYRRTLQRLVEVEKDLAKANDALRGSETVLATLQKEQPVKQTYKATAPPRPTDPSILLVALLGCVLGLGLAIGLILVFDVVQGTFKTIDEVERGLPVPVLGGMSHLETQPERERLVRTRRRVSFAAAGFVFLCVAVVTIFYIDPTRLPPVVRDVLALLLGT